MSYYQVLFGLLFTWLTLAILICVFGTDEWTGTQVRMLSEIAVLTLSDILMTFHWLEVRKKDHNYGMIARILDLANFACLAAALALVHPAVTKMVLGDEQTLNHTDAYLQSIAWGSIGIYWVLVLVWSVWTTWEDDNGINPYALVMAGAPIALLCFAFSYSWLDGALMEFALLGYTAVFIMVVALRSYGQTHESGPKNLSAG